MILQVYLDGYRCGIITWNAGQNVYPIDCGGRTGRIVKVVQNKNYLTLAEVQVFGPALVTKCSKNKCVVPKGAISFIPSGQSLTSTNGKTTAVMQGDGNFVIYCNGKSKVPVWATNTDRKPVKDGLKLQVRNIVDFRQIIELSGFFLSFHFFSSHSAEDKPVISDNNEPARRLI